MTVRFGQMWALALLSAAMYPLNTMATSPYAGEERRVIKALSDAEVEGYLAGAGMGFAKAAELNGYPGPLHVLELEGVLKLRPEQLRATKSLFAEMRAKAQALGSELVAAERALDALFASQKVETSALEATLKTIASLRQTLRQVHLDAHVKQRPILDEHQLVLYAKHRGYRSASSSSHSHSHSHSHKH